MQIFSKLYALAMLWSRHRHAPRYLAAMSFAESSFFPVPVDIMLAPMALARRDKAWYFAFIATIFSVLGGVGGYLAGYFVFDALTPWLHKLGYWERYEHIRLWFEQWGIWVVFIAGFSPIPYKLFTITAGALSMALLPFVLISLLARGARFYAVSALMVWGGEKMEQQLQKYMDIIGWTVVLIVIMAYLLYQWS